MQSLKTPLLIALTLAAGLAPRALAADSKLLLNINSVLTEAGRQRTPPTAAKPAFFYPIVAGYSELGEVVAGEKVPPRREVIQLLAKALAQQGYRVTQSTELMPPSVMLVVRWGYMNPVKQVTESSFDENGSPVERTVFFNKAQMLSLVAGRVPDDVDNFIIKRKEDSLALEEAGEPRYFITVSAYNLTDLADHSKKSIREYRKQNLLWQARISIASGSVPHLGHVLPTLVSSIAPHFGRETMPPQRVNASTVREGMIDVGTPTVTPDSSTSTTPR